MTDLIPLSHAQLAVFATLETEALARSGRVSIGGGVLAQLSQAFADSPHIQRGELAQTLCELMELFYELKNATHDELGDEELIHAMAVLFDGPAQCSVERLGDASAALLLRAASGEPCRDMNDAQDNGEDDDEYGDTEAYGDDGEW